MKCKAGTAGRWPARGRRNGEREACIGPAVSQQPPHTFLPTALAGAISTMLPVWGRGAGGVWACSGFRALQSKTRVPPLDKHQPSRQMPLPDCGTTGLVATGRTWLARHAALHHNGALLRINHQHLHFPGWYQQRGWRAVQPGEAASPGSCPSSSLGVHPLRSGTCAFAPPHPTPSHPHAHTFPYMTANCAESPGRVAGAAPAGPSHTGAAHRCAPRPNRRRDRPSTAGAAGRSAPPESQGAHLHLPQLGTHVAHLAGGLEAREHAAGRGTGASGAMLALALGAVRHVAARKAPPLDAAWAAAGGWVGGGGDGVETMGQGSREVPLPGPGGMRSSSSRDRQQAGRRRAGLQRASHRCALGLALLPRALQPAGC